MVIFFCEIPITTTTTNGRANLFQRTWSVPVENNQRKGIDEQEIKGYVETTSMVLLLQ